MASPRHEPATQGPGFIRTERGVVWRIGCKCGQTFTGQDEQDVQRQLVQHIRFWAMSPKDPGHVRNKSWGTN